MINLSNYHLRDKSLSLKAKGLLSQMLSLPEKWDYILQGLAYINREQLDAIRQAVHELERAGYIVHFSLFTYIFILLRQIYLHRIFQHRFSRRRLFQRR